MNDNLPKASSQQELQDAADRGSEGVNPKADEDIITITMSRYGHRYVSKQLTIKYPLSYDDLEKQIEDCMKELKELFIQTNIHLLSE